MITEHNELKKTNLLCRRVAVSQIEFSNLMKEIKKFCEDNFLIVTNIITVTYSIKQSPEGQILDVEILLEIQNMEQDSVMPEHFSIKKELSIINAINLHYEGNQQESVSSFNEINNYLVTNKLQAITSAYTVSHNPYNQPENIINMDIYVGINPNIM